MRLAQTDSSESEDEEATGKTVPVKQVKTGTEERKMTLSKKKEKLATLAQSILTNPEEQVKEQNSHSFERQLIRSSDRKT
jgi:hypothetical protein